MRPARRRRGSRWPRRRERAAAAGAAKVAPSRAGIQLSLPDLAPRSALLQIARLAGAAGCSCASRSLPGLSLAPSLVRAGQSLGQQRWGAEDTVSAARREPDAKASADWWVARLLGACRVPAPAAALTKIGIAAAAAGAGAAPRTRPAPRRPRRAEPGASARTPRLSLPTLPPRRYHRAQFETPSYCFPRFLYTSRFCPCLDTSGGRPASWQQRHWPLIRKGITQAIESQ